MDRAFVQNKRMRGTSIGEKLFFAALIIVPVCNFLLFAIGGTLQSLLLSFQKYSMVKGHYEFAGLYNYIEFIESFIKDPLLFNSIGNSIVFYLATLLIVTPAGWLFSFMVYKKYPCSRIIKVILFMPTVINGLVFIVIYKALVQDGLTSILANFGIRLENAFRAEETGFMFLMIYTVWMSMCGSILVGTGIMSKISKELIEASKIDGCTILHELWHIVLPEIYSVVIIGYAMGILTIFNGSPSTFAFFNTAAPDHTYTIGYYMFIKVMKPSGIPETIYPYTAAAGILINYLTLPLVLGLKKLLEKIGPSEV